MKNIAGFIFFLFNLFASGQELLSVEEVSRPISQYSIREWNMNNGLPNNAVMDIQKTSEGFMWLATFNGLVRFDGRDFEVYNRTNTPEFTTNSISSLMVDASDNLWVGTNGGGLLRYKNGVFTRFQSDSLNGSIITAIAEGENGILWIGTRFGLVKMNNESLVKFSVPDFENANITALFYDHKQRLWVGTATKGLYVLDDNGTFGFSKSHGLQSNFVRAVFVDSKDNVWIGTDQGIAMINSSGVQKMDSVKGAPTVFTNRFLEDSEGNIWIASNDGLRRFTDSFELVDSHQEIGRRIVQSLFKDQEHNIWAGTYRVGLCRLNQSKFLLLGRQEGLSNEVINVTYSDDSILWAGSDNGLICSKGGKIRDIYRRTEECWQ